ncbi:GNAT family N-acetyltransferase [Parabacteroides sp. AM08-6]|uniref:GNAT family N-acetyltransferase n=1 Tax=Parabacteroides sp. AM08-6 TaxID=2292053 RepID=UPI000EFF2BB7|nr:GNAT family N-acetyltransferase [Parabacteroides sp. AM08-6]RHJ87785.1 GNAT family N-acetyltransferase [Parabacteroides sp. AM08-6]
MFSIRKATIEDCPLINKLASKIWEPTYGSILSREQLDYMFDMMYAPENLLKQINELHHQFFIIYADGEPSGYLSIETVDRDLYEFQKIYSLPALHGTGIGRYIIEQGIEYLKSIHPEPFTVELNVNRQNPAVGFYKHMGFHEHATRDFHIGDGYYMNDYIMRMDVKNS